MARHYGDTVRLERERRGLTLLQAAEQAGIGYSLLCEIERGTRPAPNGDLITIRIAETVGVDPVKLLSLALRERGWSMVADLVERSPGFFSQESDCG